ncbi:MAG: hypothetical protein ACRDJE_19830 [Dehalococcoidia bacterium]
MTVKQQLLRAVERLPDNAGYNQAVDLLDFLRAIFEGIRQAEAGMTIPHEDVLRIMAKWLPEGDDVFEAY